MSQQRDCLIASRCGCPRTPLQQVHVGLVVGGDCVRLYPCPLSSFSRNNHSSCHRNRLQFVLVCESVDHCIQHCSCICVVLNRNQIGYTSAAISDFFRHPKSCVARGNA